MKSSPQVLLVDTNPKDVRVVREVIESLGLGFHLRSDGTSAIEAFHAIQPDLVLIDAESSETGGVSISKELKHTERGRTVPVILLGPETLVTARRRQTIQASGCTTLLQKPLTPQDLLDALSRFLPNAFIAEPGIAASGGSPTATQGVSADGAAKAALETEDFDEASLGSLLDQVFPSSDAGDLAGALARKARAGVASRVDSGVGLKSGSELGSGGPSESDPRKEPAADPRRHVAVGSGSDPAVGSADPGAGAWVDATDEENLFAFLDQVFPNVEVPTKEASAAAPTVVSPASPAPAAQAKPRAPEPRPASPAGERAAPSIQQAGASTPHPAAPTPERAVLAPQSVASTPQPAAPTPERAVLASQSLASTPQPAVSTPELAVFPPQPAASTPDLAVLANHPAGAAQDPAPSDGHPVTSAQHPAPIQHPAAAGPPTPAEPVSVLPRAQEAGAPPPSQEKPAAPVGGEAIPLRTEHTASTPSATADKGADDWWAPKRKKGLGKGDFPRKPEHAAEPAHPSADSDGASLSGRGSQLESQRITTIAVSDTVLPPPETRTPDPARESTLASSLQASRRAKRATRRTVWLVVVAVALAASVGGLYLLFRSSDTDLQPPRPGAASPVQEDLDPGPETPPVLPEAGSEPAVTESESSLGAPPFPERSRQGEPGPGRADADASDSVGSGRHAAAGPSALNRPPYPAESQTARKTSSTPRPSPVTRPPATTQATSAAPPSVTKGPGGTGASPLKVSSDSRPPSPTTAARTMSDTTPPSTTPLGESDSSSRSRADKSAAAGAGSRETPEETSRMDEAESPPPTASGSSQPPPLEPARTMPNRAAGDDPSNPAEESTSGDVIVSARAGEATPADPPSAPPVIDAEPFTSPVPLRRGAPSYPLVAHAMKLGGTVGLLIRVSEEGKVTDVRVTRSAGPPLDRAAAYAARGWIYKPARRGSRPISAWIEELVEFKVR